MEIFPELTPTLDLTSEEWKKVGFQVIQQKKEICFQNKNPRSDFRGGGIMSLQCIHYFVKFYKHVNTFILFY